MNYVGYARISTVKQLDGYSLGAQVRIIEDYLKSLPYSANLVQIFQEQESGRVDARPQLAAALALAKQVKGTLILPTLDRLSRNASFVLALIESKVPIVCCNCPNTDTLSLSIMAVLASREASLCSERTRNGMREAARRGVKMGNPRFQDAIKSAHSTIQANKSAFAADMLKIVKDIQETGVNTLDGLSECLNRRGYTGRRGGAWTATSVARLLKSTGATL